MNETSASMGCGRCHGCGRKLVIVRAGVEWCKRCGRVHYRAHGDEGATDITSCRLAVDLRKLSKALF